MRNCYYFQIHSFCLLIFLIENAHNFFTFVYSGISTHGRANQMTPVDRMILRHRVLWCCCHAIFEAIVENGIPLIHSYLDLGATLPSSVGACSARRSARLLCALSSAPTLISYSNCSHSCNL